MSARTLNALVFISILGLATASFSHSAAHAASGGAGPTKSKTKKKSSKRSSKGLSGQKGKVKGWHSATGKCRSLQKRYVKAAGHSAYAATPGSQYEASVCGVAFNKGTTAQAEKTALNTCQRGLSKWKVASNKRCVVYMSK